MNVLRLSNNATSILLLVLFSGSSVACATPNASLNPERWVFSWSDEFDYTGKPNPEIWDYDYGYLGFNEELQNYTDQSKNVRVENGNLVIEARLDAVSAKRSKEVVKELKGSGADVSILGNKEFTSARLVTRGKKNLHMRGWKHVRALLRVAVLGQRSGCLVIRQMTCGLYAVRWILWSTSVTIQTTCTRPFTPSTQIS